MIVGPTALVGMSDDAIGRLAELADYDFIDLCLIPGHQDLPRPLAGNQATIGEVHVDEGHVVLHRPTSRSLLGPHRTYEHFRSLEGEGSEGAAIEYLRGPPEAPCGSRRGVSCGRVVITEVGPEVRHLLHLA